MLADLAATGNPMVVLAQGGRAYGAPLSRDSTALLVAALLAVTGVAAGRLRRQLIRADQAFAAAEDKVCDLVGKRNRVHEAAERLRPGCGPFLGQQFVDQCGRSGESYPIALLASRQAQC